MHVSEYGPRVIFLVADPVIAVWVPAPYEQSYLESSPAVYLSVGLEVSGEWKENSHYLYQPALAISYLCYIREGCLSLDKSQALTVLGNS